MNNRRPVLLGIVVLSLLGCEPPPPHPQLAVLDQARARGDLNQQHSALQILTQLGQTGQKTGFDQALAQIQQVKALNQQAKQQLLADKFAALALAIKADKLLFNQDSRQLIKHILNPYIDFYQLKPQLQQWSYPPLDKVVVAQSMPEAAQNWRQPMTAPQLWPNSALIKALQTPNGKLNKLWPQIAQERKDLVELVRATLIMKNKLENDPMLDALHQDTLIINTMYNTVLTDFQWHYLKQAMKATIKGNLELIEVATQAIEDKLSAQQWQIDYQLSKGIYEDKVNFCCLYYSNMIHVAFPHFESPSAYTTAVKAIHSEAKHIFEQSFSANKSPEQTIKDARQYNLQLNKHLNEIGKLEKQPKRKTIANDYLRTIYRWQQGDFNQLETLLGDIRDYRSAIRIN